MGQHLPKDLVTKLVHFFTFLRILFQDQYKRNVGKSSNELVLGNMKQEEELEELLSIDNA